jgi:hypothetical protein
MRKVILMAMMGFLPLIIHGAASPNTPAKKVDQAPKAQTNSAPNQPGSEAAPFFIKVVQARDVEAEAAREKKDEDRDGWDRAMAIATVALAFITFSLALYTAKLFYATKAMAGEAKDTSKAQAIDTQAALIIAGKSADAAKESADAAKAMVSVIEGNGQKQMRAYLSVFPNTYFPQKKEGTLHERRLRVYMILRNSGYTPARAVNFQITANLIECPLPDGFELGPLSIRLPGKSHIAPGREHIMQAEMKYFLNEEQEKEMRDPLYPRKLCIFGRVEYKDVFDKDHFTNFCHWAVWNSGGDFGTENAHRCNDAD